MRHWMAACSAGEALGIAGVALAYAAVERGHLSGAAPILAAGTWEGLCLGLAQSLVLAGAGISRVRWTLATAACAVAGYGLSLAAGAGAGQGGDGAAPALWLLVLAGAGSGLVLGPLMAAAQVWAACGALPWRRWVAGNAVGWAWAMAVILGAATTVGGDWPLPAVAAAGLLAGGLAGLGLGLATRPGLPRQQGGGG